MRKVTLLKAHTDHGIDHPIGAEISVDEPTARWLEDRGIVAKAKKKVVQIDESNEIKGNV